MPEQDEQTLKVQQLFVKYQGQLFAFAVSLWPDFARAEDVIQEVFLTVTAKAHEFDPQTSFLAWGKAIVRLKLLEFHRAAKRNQSSEAMLECLISSCPEDWAGEEKLAALTHCMAELAPRAREVILLRYRNEHGPSEIARRLARTVNSINVTLSKARVALRECLDRQLDQGRLS
ncbi:sigma-70 family RNA polymerase sigma factor [Planctomicrobium sp. SH661]|uniref:sigma-70 family RNA polymerase sigma factor n=1 Tax=Planctomicrobium sp. SH661 TaxID=3448124 RepID=UPI003F5C368B